MENLKKKSFTLALGLTMLLGSSLAFLPAKADDEALGKKKACWTASSGGDGSYLDCNTCTTLSGDAAGPQQMGCKNPIIE